MVMVVYTAVTLFPFYALFIRSFVPTKESADLHLWLPETEEVSMDAQVGNLSVFYDLDLRILKDALGIPQTEFFMSRTTLRQIGEKVRHPRTGDQGFFCRVLHLQRLENLADRGAVWHQFLGSAAAGR